MSTQRGEVARLRASRPPARAPAARLAATAVCAALALGACTSGGDRSAADTAASDTRPAEVPTTSTGWNPQALARAHALADALVAGGLACDDRREWDRAAVAADYGKRLPVPAAMSRCVGPDGEDLTFEVFADDDARDDFYASKLYLVCRSARTRGLEPRLAYVEGPGWLIEPDEPDTADRIAAILHADSKVGTCPPAPATAP